MNNELFIEIGKNVLKDEAHALIELCSDIDINFSNACKTILKTKGKVILTGVGKSGHVASKIASTLASTGTQSFFVQAGEAAHGDLGMIGNDDCVIAVSNSGESAELRLLTSIIKKRKIKLIAIVGNNNSNLAHIADIVLYCPVKNEACPLNLAPTTSTTAELALGDALAVALIHARGFTKNDFALSHPGGALGRKLLIHCKDIMHTDSEIPVVTTKTTLKEALYEITKKGLGFVCITDEEKNIKGIFTDGDLRRTLKKNNVLNMPMEKIMTCPVRGLISQDVLANEALRKMQLLKITSMIVINENNKLIGAFNIHDVMKAGLL